MPQTPSQVDPDGLLEYSVVYTDRALNHMSARFQQVMNDVSSLLKQTYNAHSSIIVPGSGTFGMEAVARQFATDRRCLVIRNGWFSYRWSQIFEMGDIPAQTEVMHAQRDGDNTQAPFEPAPIETVVAEIREKAPELVFAPHVETASGMLLPDDYLKAVADAVHEVGGLFVLDCIASGALWVDMQACGVDVLISAPQKGWSSSPCAAMVMLSEAARRRIDETTSTSYACDLRKWLQIMETYENGGHAYHATMPTDGLARLRDMMLATREFGLDAARARQQELGDRVRESLENHGFPSVSGAGFRSPTVVVSYTDDAGIQSGRKFIDLGIQSAAGVPLMCDEGDSFQSFRIGLFGLDKLENVDRTVDQLEQALERLG